MSARHMKVEFYPPCEPWSVNQKRHWAAERRDREQWLWITFSEAVEVRPPGLFLEPSNVRVTIPFETNNRRDPHNYTGTVVKAIIDGLVKAGYWPDDTAEFVTVIDPVLRVGGPVVIEIEERTP